MPGCAPAIWRLKKTIPSAGRAGLCLAHVRWPNESALVCLDQDRTGSGPGEVRISIANQIASMISPFEKSPQDSTAGQEMTIRPALIAFLLCFVLGLTAVAWRAKGQAERAQALARTEALARGGAVELQLSHAATAAEVLGALVWQSGGANFQPIATALMKAHPGLDCLELQPGGVVSAIVPRAGHERGIGLNVLKDPAQRQYAYAAIQRRGLTVAGPVLLSPGEPGIVVRVPIFRRGRDGRDAFWGLVAVSMRLSDALARAQVDTLGRQGYNYAFILRASPWQKTLTIAAHGAVSLQDAVQAPVRVQNLEFHLALAPRGGWVNKGTVLLESFGALIVSGLAGLLAHLLASRRGWGAALAQGERQLSCEIAERKRAQGECRAAQEQAAGAQAQLNQARSALQQIEPAAKESQARLEAMLRSAEEASQSARTACGEAEARANQLQERLEAAVRTGEEAAAAKQAELEEARRVQQEAGQRAAGLQADLEAALRAREEGAGAAQGQQEQDRATIAQLEARLEAANRSAKEAAAANAVRLKEAEESNEELIVRLREAEQAQAQANAPATDKGEAGPEAPLKQVAEDPSPAPEPGPKRKTLKGPKRKPARRDDQMDLFGAGQAAPAADKAQAAGGTASLEPPDGKPASAQRPAPVPPVDPAQLRKAIHLMLPLLTDQDPGAKDCLKANRETFRAAFAGEACEEFEEKVKGSEFGGALELLKKASKKHGIPV